MACFKAHANNQGQYPQGFIVTNFQKSKFSLLGSTEYFYFN